MRLRDVGGRVFGGMAGQMNGKEKEKRPWRHWPSGPDRAIHPSWPGYPLSGCFPALPDSVSPGDGQYTTSGKSEREVPRTTHTKST
jgi:hypothetical protein